MLGRQLRGGHLLRPPPPRRPPARLPRPAMAGEGRARRGAAGVAEGAGEVARPDAPVCPQEPEAAAAPRAATICSGASRRSRGPSTRTWRKVRPRAPRPPCAPRPRPRDPERAPRSPGSARAGRRGGLAGGPEVTKPARCRRGDGPQTGPGGGSGAGARAPGGRLLCPGVVTCKSRSALRRGFFLRPRRCVSQVPSREVARGSGGGQEAPRDPGAARASRARGDALTLPRARGRGPAP